MTNNNAIEKALGALNPQPLAVVDYRAAEGAGAVKGYVTLQLPSGEIIEGCALSEMGSTRWITIPSSRELQADGSFIWRSRIPFASAAEEIAFQSWALLAVDRFLKETAPAAPPQAPSLEKGQLLEMHSAIAGKFYLVADEADAENAVATRGIPRGQIFTPQERQLLEGIDPALRPEALRFKRHLSIALTAGALAAWQEARIRREVKEAVSSNQSTQQEK